MKATNIRQDYTVGNYATAVDDTDLIAIVFARDTGKIVKRYHGETAWADAIRKADDLNAAGK